MRLGMSSATGSLSRRIQFTGRQSVLISHEAPVPISISKCVCVHSANNRCVQVGRQAGRQNNASRCAENAVLLLPN